jgi:hypothetical protein
MSMSDAAENAFLLLLFNATTWDDIAEDDTTTPATNLYVSLHTGDPTDSGGQTSNETSYTDYARVAVARSGSGWTVSANSVSPAATIEFPECGGGTATITHFGVGLESAGAGALLFSGTVSPNISVSSGVTPQLTTATAISIN